MTETKAKHTLGPWEMHAGEDYVVVMLPGECTENASIDVRFENAEANARLIAAAPELFKALNLLVPVCKAWLEDAQKADPHGWQSLDDDIEIAEAAIRKAKGE